MSINELRELLEALKEAVEESGRGEEGPPGTVEERRAELAKILAPLRDSAAERDVIVRREAHKRLTSTEFLAAARRHILGTAPAPGFVVGANLAHTVRDILILEYGLDAEMPTLDTESVELRITNLHQWILDIASPPKTEEVMSSSSD